jgi:hypothetical protein
MRINGVEMDFQETKDAGIIMLIILVVFLIIIASPIILGQ